MTQQLTIDQLKFARSIGATRYLKGGTWSCKSKSWFFYKDNYVWRDGCWVKSRRANTGNKHPLIDFSPLDGIKSNDPEVNQVAVDPEYVTEVGDWCLSSGGAQMFYIGKRSDGDGVFELENGELTCFDSLDGFRPLPDPEQQRRDELLERWRRRSLDYAHDTEQSQVSLARVFDFIVGMEG